MDRAPLGRLKIALEADSVVLEVKPGPYEPTTDKDFAPCAPEEGSATAEGYRMKLTERTSLRA